MHNAIMWGIYYANTLQASMTCRFSVIFLEARLFIQNLPSSDTIHDMLLSGC